MSCLEDFLVLFEAFWLLVEAIGSVCWFGKYPLTLGISFFRQCQV